MDWIRIKVDVRIRAIEKDRVEADDGLWLRMRDG